LLYHYGQTHGYSLRDYLFAYQHRFLSIAAKLPLFYNHVAQWKIVLQLAKTFLRIDGLPRVSPFRGAPLVKRNNGQQKATIFLFVDEMAITDERDLGTQAIQLLQRLGYDVRLAPIAVSGRTFLSKGMLDKAKDLAIKNVKALAGCIAPNAPLVGIEPSAILTFRDEYPELVDEALLADANHIARHTFTIEEFLWREMEAGNIGRHQFTDEQRHVEFHAHCYQKSLSQPSVTQNVLSFPTNYTSGEIKSGCCGMAGSFGYETEHAPLARQIGELVLFPAVRAFDADTLVVAAGASCRAHLVANTQRQALHPVEVLLMALRQP
jgi:Fe-S oxidoreductase